MQLDLQTHMTLDKQKHLQHAHTYTIWGGQSDSEKEDDKVSRDHFPD